MEIRQVLLTVLATVPLTGCTSVWNCHPPTEKFSIDEPVDAARLDELVEAYAVTSWDELECDDVCRAVYQEVRGWDSGEIASCTLTLPQNQDGSDDGQIVCRGTGYEYFCEGRRPLGHVEAGDELCRDPLGRSLAAMAHLEAASVVAFEQLAVQLEAWAAPAELIERCQLAAADERAHTRWLSAVAERHGARVPEAAPAREPTTPSPVEVALHNAVEGCVHETFAALMAAYRARGASHPSLRQLFAKLAADETRHGQLAWDLHAWLLGQLSVEEVEVVEAAQRRALAQLPARARELAKLPIELGPLTPHDAEGLAASMVALLAA